jgi:hypothetical protein
MPPADLALALFIMQILAAAFLAVLFLQSGIDKVTDRKGNLEWLTGHFAKSPLEGMVPLLLTVITVLEIAAGALSAAGVAEIALMRTTLIAFWGAVLAGIAILCLFFGQRMAKDYAGASGLVPYFLVTLFAIALLAAR